MSQQLYPETPILLVDDEEDFLKSMRVNLRLNSISNVKSCSDNRAVMHLLKKNKYSLILLDLLMPHISGQELLPKIVEEYPEIPVIVLTAVDEIKIAVECMKAGAYDYLIKPIETLALIKSVLQTLNIMDVRGDYIRMQESLLSVTLKNPEAFSEIITQYPGMYNIFKYIEAVASSKYPVLITGESGTGKDLIARAIHKASGRMGNYVSKKVGGMDDAEFSRELFGNEQKGLVERAKGGTLFLDEIGDISIQSQVKLLPLIPERDYLPLGDEMQKPSDVRIVTATSRYLETIIDKGEFRKDLYFRLRIHKLDIPPLRERKEDIPLLVEHFLKISGQILKKKKPRIPKSLFPFLANYDYPGNIRELGGMVYDAMNKHKSGVLSLDTFREKIKEEKKKRDISSDLRHFEKTSTLRKKVTFSNSFPTFKEMNRVYLQEAMKRAGEDHKIAAELTDLPIEDLEKHLQLIKKENKEKNE